VVRAKIADYKNRGGGAGAKALSTYCQSLFIAGAGDRCCKGKECDFAYAFDNVPICCKDKKSLLHKGLTASIEVIS